MIIFLCQNFLFKLNDEQKEDIERLKIMLTIENINSLNLKLKPRRDAKQKFNMK